MKNLVVINDKEVNFEVVDGEVFTTSLDIAAVFEKQHQHIIAKIKSINDENFRRSNFRPSRRVAISGFFEREQPYYKISKNGAAFLIMGFTGEKAEIFKIQFLEAYDKVLKENQKLKENFAIGKEQFDQSLNLIASAMQTMLKQNSAILELLRQKNEGEFKLCDKPISRVYHKRLSNEEKFLEKVIALLRKDEGLSQGELLARIGRRKDDRTALRWLHSYDGIYWRANLLDAGKYTYSYSLIEE